MIDFIQIQTTYPDEASARRAARYLVEHRVVACAQVLGPIHSTYFWEGRLEESTEWLCLLKTRRLLFEMAAETIRVHHPYECPQIVATPIASMSNDYSQWLVEQTAAVMPEKKAVAEFPSKIAHKSAK